LTQKIGTLRWDSTTLGSLVTWTIHIIEISMSCGPPENTSRFFTRGRRLSRSLRNWSNCHRQRSHRLPRPPWTHGGEMI